MKKIDYTRSVTDCITHAYHAMESALPTLAIGLTTLLVFWLLGLLAQRVIIRLSNHSKTRRYLLRLLGKSAKVALIITGIITGLGTVGIDITALVTGLGLVGFAIAFALKDSLSNILAGFILLFYQPFCIGDQISVAKETGVVIDINLRYTVLHTDSTQSMIPNATVLTSVVTISQNKSKTLQKH